MKIKILTVSCLIFFACSCFAQDIIVTKDAKRIDAKVTEVNVDNIRYKRFDNPDGPLYTVSKKNIASIIYQNGQVEAFTSETTQTTQATRQTTATTSTRPASNTQTRTTTSAQDEDPYTINFLKDNSSASRPTNPQTSATTSTTNTRTSTTTAKKVQPEPEKKEVAGTICQYCNGTKTIVCFTCNGTGGHYNFNPFNGASTFVNCITCGGYKYLWCSCIGVGAFTAVRTGVREGGSGGGQVRQPPPPEERGGTKRVTCTLCNGTGKSPTKIFPPQYTLYPTLMDKRCEICGDIESHSHGTCPSCRGRGYTESIVW